MIRRLLSDRATTLAIVCAALAALTMAGLIAAGVGQHRERIEALRLVDATLAELEQVRAQADAAAAEAERERDELLERIEELTRQVEQLQDQVRDLGGTPAQPTATPPDHDPPEATETSSRPPPARPSEPASAPSGSTSGPDDPPEPAPPPQRPPETVPDPPDDEPSDPEPLCLVGICLPTP